MFRYEISLYIWQSEWFRFAILSERPMIMQRGRAPEAGCEQGHGTARVKRGHGTRGANVATGRWAANGAPYGCGLLHGRLDQGTVVVLHRGLNQGTAILLRRGLDQGTAILLHRGLDQLDEGLGVGEVGQDRVRA